MKYSILILISTIACLLQGCKKEQHINQFSFSRKALNYVKLDLGKYLVYKDSATSLEDSVVVTKSQLNNLYSPGTGGDFGYPEYNYEVFDLVLTKFDGNIQSEWFNGEAAANSSSTGLYNSKDNVPVWMTEQNDTMLVFVSNESSTYNLSMTVEGRVYNNVIENIFTNGPDNTAPGYKNTIYYWAKPVGIIKRTTIIGSSIKTYTLLRNN